jgi:GNAT superfamily N-acetyltransferase
MVVRPSRPEELEAAGQVVRRAYAADGWGVGDSYGDRLADARSWALDAEVAVALDTGVVVGCVTFVLPGTRLAEISRPGEAEFRMLGVDPDHRGRGIGEALVRWCLDQARELDAHRLLLSSERRMAGAHRLYLRLGFVRSPELDWSPNAGTDLLAFSYPL